MVVWLRTMGLSELPARGFRPLTHGRWQVRVLRSMSFSAMLLERVKLFERLDGRFAPGVANPRYARQYYLSFRRDFGRAIWGNPSRSPNKGWLFSQLFLSGMSSACVFRFLRSVFLLPHWGEL